MSNRDPHWIYALVLMVVIIVAIDLLFFRHRLKERLVANVAIVIVFAIFYLMFLRRK